MGSGHLRRRGGLPPLVRQIGAHLTPLEAARLAAILPNPNRYRANPPGPYVNDRSYTIAARANSVSLYGEDRCAKP